VDAYSLCAVTRCILDRGILLSLVEKGPQSCHLNLKNVAQAELQINSCLKFPRHQEFVVDLYVRFDSRPIYSTPTSSPSIFQIPCKLHSIGWDKHVDRIANLDLCSPEVGPLIGGFLNQYTNWRWSFYVLMIWAGVQLALIVFFVPETYHPALLRQKAIKLREESKEERWIAPIERMDRSIARTILWSCIRPFQLLVLEPMVSTADESLDRIILHLTLGLRDYADD
jgi:hypothetical protein